MTAPSCPFTRADALRFHIINLPILLINGWGLYLAAPWLLVLWIVAGLAFLSLVMTRALCAHCPHYAGPGRVLRCWVLAGPPKIWRYRPEPTMFWEDFVLGLGLLMVYAAPMLAMAARGRWMLLAVALSSLAAATVALRGLFCQRCDHKYCPFRPVAKRG